MADYREQIMDTMFINREHSRSLSGCVFLNFHWQEDNEWAAGTTMLGKGGRCHYCLNWHQR